MPDPISEADAWDVLAELARGVQAELGDGLECLTAFGSLVNGDYVPGFSDIDQVIVVRPGSGPDRNVELADRVVRTLNRRPGKFRDSLHEGYVVRRDGLWSLDLDREDTLVLRDVVDLARHGRTLAGRHIWPGVRSPSEAELRESVVCGVFWIPDKLPNLKSLLNCIFAVGGARFYCETGTMTWTKRELAIAYGGRTDLPFRELVVEATALRARGRLAAEDSASALQRLQPEYTKFLAQTRTWMSGQGLNRLRRTRTTVPGLVVEPGPAVPPFGR